MQDCCMHANGAALSGRWRIQAACMQMKGPQNMHCHMLGLSIRVQPADLDDFLTGGGVRARLALLAF